MLPSVYTITEAATLAKRTEKAMRQLRARGQGPRFHKVDGRLLVTEAELAAWLAGGAGDEMTPQPASVPASRRRRTRRHDTALGPATDGRPSTLTYDGERNGTTPVPLAGLHEDHIEGGTPDGEPIEQPEAESSPGVARHPAMAPSPARPPPTHAWNWM